jgi:hypothetical protein
MQTKTLVKFGVAALAMGAFFQASLPVKADQLVWVRAQQLDYFKVRGLVPPGSYSNKDNQKPDTIGVSKSRKGVGKKNRLSPSLDKRTAHQATNLNKADERWLNIY